MPYKDPERAKARGRAYRAAHKEHRAAVQKEYYAANKGVIIARVKTWIEDNRERHNAYVRTWGKANRDQTRAACARARARRMNATPPWQDTAELDAIWMACPEGHHVDHVYPLAGKMSCGLNVPWNLQYLPADENKAKSNQMPQPGYLDWFGHDNRDLTTCQL